MNSELDHIKWCVSEEASEIGHIMGKIGRFGINDKNPITGIPDLVSLDAEVHDLIAVYEMFLAEIGKANGLIEFDRDKINAKKIKVIKYMEYAREMGELSN